MPPGDRAPLCIWFDGFDDSGRIKLFVTSSGRLRAEYTHHPVLKPTGSAWKRDIEVGKDEVATLVAEIAGDDVARAELPRTPRTPGKEIALSALRASRGTAQPFLDSTFAETPPALTRAVAEMRRLFALAKARSR